MSGDDFADEKTIIGDLGHLKREAAEETSEQAYLRLLTGPHQGQLFRVGDGGDLGRGNDVSFRILDSQISRRHARLLRVGGEFVLHDLQSTNGTFVNGERIVMRALREGDLINLGQSTSLRLVTLKDEDVDIQAQMFENALRDALTKAYNRRFFETRLEEEVAYSIRQESRLALLYFDLDHFKSVNDTYGHLAGDFALAEFAALVQAERRREDVFARIGGEEFAILARGLDLEQGRDFADRIRRVIAAHDFRYEGRKLPITTSVGVACMPGPESASALVAAADAALYRAKGNGRNRVEVAPAVST
ncbi:MAG: GGDEF domain-containing protein [Myxococcales bacterium]|nr:GGDEF domain-containing protein [Myxococcales bacterium]